MKRSQQIAFSLMISLCILLFSQGVRAEDRPAKLPAGFRLIGKYKLNSKMRVESGEVMPVVILPLVYRVFSDGIDVRVYCHAAGDESFTSYRIYRSDGVGVVRGSGEIDIVAGVQASCTQGDMLRQISVTRTSFTMVKMPPRSHRVLITRAKAIAESPAPATSGRSEPQGKYNP